MGNLLILGGVGNAVLLKNVCLIMIYVTQVFLLFVITQHIQNSVGLYYQFSGGHSAFLQVHLCHVCSDVIVPNTLM